MRTNVFLVVVCAAVAAACDADRAGPPPVASAPVAPVAPVPPSPAGPAPRSATGPAEAPASAAAPLDWPATPPAELACRWHVTLRKAGEAQPRCRWDFYLWRTAGVVETLESHNNTGETWRRDASGRVTGYEKSFHVERKVVEYAAGDLAATGTVPDWDRIASVIDPKSLASALAAAGEQEYRGRRLASWSGRIEPADVELLWAADLCVPVRIRRTSPVETLEFELRAVHALADAPWPRPRSRSYEWTDFADVGDKVADPFFRRLLAPGGAFASNCKH